MRSIKEILGYEGSDSEEESDPVSELQRLISGNGNEDNRQGLPCYEMTCSEIGEGWGFEIPRNIRASSIGETDFLYILKTLEFSLPQQQQPILSLNHQFNSLQRSICEKPLQCSMSQFYLYLMILKRTTRVFENSNAVFLSPFAHCRVTQSSHFIYAYINGLLFATIRLYEEIRKRAKPERKSALDLLTCQQLFLELRKCFDYCLSERFIQSTRHFYQQSPSFISSADSRGDGSRLRMIEKERQILRNYINRDLGGLDAVNARIVLLGIKRHEILVEMLCEKIGGKSIIVKSGFIYDTIAPIMKKIMLDYKSLPAIIGQGYTAFMSYYWYLRMELTIARSDFELFQADNFIDFNTFGQRAMKRLTVLTRSLQTKQDWLASFKLSQTQRQRLQSIREEIQKHYDVVKEEVTNFNEEIAEVPEIVTYREPPEEEGEDGLRDLMEKEWDSHHDKSLKTAFDIIASAQISSFPSSLPPVSSSITNDKISNHGMSTEAMEAVLKERVAHLDWLVDMIDQNGEIHISKKGADFLKDQLSLTRVSRV